MHNWNKYFTHIQRVNKMMQSFLNLCSSESPTGFWLQSSIYARQETPSRNFTRATGCVTSNLSSHPLRECDNRNPCSLPLVTSHPSMKPLSPTTRRAIVYGYNSGHSGSTIAQKVKCSKTAVNRVLKQYPRDWFNDSEKVNWSSAPP